MMLGKIFKEKDKRDSALLIGMAVITIAFMVYIFVPMGKKEKKAPEPEPPKTTAAQETALEEEPQPTPKPVLRLFPKRKKKKEPEPVIEEPKEDPLLAMLRDLNDKLDRQLKQVYSQFIKSRTSFAELPVKDLEKILKDFHHDTIDKLFKFSFYDLNQLASFRFPEQFNQPETLRFNLFLSMFLVKLREEKIVDKFGELTDGEFESMVNVDAYGLLGNEPQEDYHLIPILFYFKELSKRLPVYPVSDEPGFFKEKIQSIRDLTASKYLVQIREALRFSISRVRYRIRWREADSMLGDDKAEYGGIRLRTYHFLDQYYLVFPDAEQVGNNRWMNELADSDNGDIELVELDITSEDPIKPLHLRTIIYSPGDSRFVVLLKEKDYTVSTGDNFLHYRFKQRMKRFHRNFIKLRFGWNPKSEAGEKLFKKQLEAFGNFLKKVNRLLERKTKKS